MGQVGYYNNRKRKYAALGKYSYGNTYAQKSRKFAAGAKRAAAITLARAFKQGGGWRMGLRKTVTL